MQNWNEIEVKRRTHPSSFTVFLPFLLIYFHFVYRHENKKIWQLRKMLNVNNVKGAHVPLMILTKQQFS